MPDWIYLLPDDAIIALSVAIIVGGTFLAMFVSHHAIRFRLPPDKGNPVLEGYRVVVSLTALILAFSLVQAQTNLRSVETDLRQEASTLVELDHELLRPGDVTAELRNGLERYGHALLADEWPRLVGGGRSRLADDLLRSLQRMASVITVPSLVAPGYRDDLLRKLERLSELRESRITSATLRLSPAFWRATVALVLVSILLAGLAPWNVPNLASLLPVAAALAVLFALVAIVDVPFRGESAVRPTELRRAVDTMQSRG